MQGHNSGSRGEDATAHGEAMRSEKPCSKENFWILSAVPQIVRPIINQFQYFSVTEMHVTVGDAGRDLLSCAATKLDAVLWNTLFQGDHHSERTVSVCVCVCVCVYSDYLYDDDHSVTTGSAFIRRLIPEMCPVHFFFLPYFFESFFPQKRELSLEIFFRKF